MKYAALGSLVNLVVASLFIHLPAMAEDVPASPGPGALAPIEVETNSAYPAIEGEAVLEPGDSCGICAPAAVLDDCIACCGCEICGSGDCPAPLWYLRNEVRILTASKVRATDLTREFVGIEAVVDAYGNDDTADVYAPRMGTKSVNFDVAAGYGVTVGRYLGCDGDNCDQFLEFSYWGIDQWTTGRQVTGERVTRDYYLEGDEGPATSITHGALFSPFEISIGGFSRADVQQIHYDLDVHNWEVNLRFVPRNRPDRLVMHPNGQWQRQFTPGEYFSFLAGIRVMSLNEGLQYTSRGVVCVDGVDRSVSGEYGVMTHNDLLGFQIGAEYTVRQCRWQYGARIKVGPYINFADQDSWAESQAAGDPLATTELDFSRNKERDDAAFIGEFGFFTYYKLRPNLILHASYDFMWVVGLARAPEQLIFVEDPPVDLNTNGHTYLHGLTLGLEVDW